MGIERCFELLCMDEIEYSCECTYPWTYSCDKHWSKHCQSSKNQHTFKSLFLQPFEDTREKILNFLTEENTKILDIKMKIVASFNETISSLEKVLKVLLNELDSCSTKINFNIEKIYQIKRISKIEQDPVLSLLISDTDEALERSKRVFKWISDSNDDCKFFYEMKEKIEKHIYKLHEKNLLMKKERSWKEHGRNDSIYWEYLECSGEFTPFRGVSCWLIEAAYAKGSSSIHISIAGTYWKITFGDPHVLSISNSNLVTVRRNFKSPENADSVDEIKKRPKAMWYWLSHDNIFKEYSVEASKQIEIAYINKDGALIQGQNMKVYIILPERRLQISEKTQYERKICRETDNR